MSIYETKTMLKAIGQKKPVFTFLRDVFFTASETLLTEKAEIDVKKGRRKLAPFVAPRIGGVVMTRDGFKTDVIKTPKIAPIRVLTADDIKKRTPGEDVYSQRTPDERAQVLLAQDMIELDEAITRREEWMCAQVLFNGGIVIEVDGAKQNVDYGFTNKKTLSGTARWGQSAGKVYENLKAWRSEIIKSTGKIPNIVVMAEDVADAFIEDPNIQKLMDLARLNIGSIEPTYQGNGVTFIGRLPGLGLEIYTYSEYYIEDGEESQEASMIPSGKLIMGSRALGKRYYGAVTQMEKGSFVTFEGTRIPKHTTDDKNEIEELRMTSRPLPVPEDVDSWIVAAVL